MIMPTLLAIIVLFLAPGPAPAASPEGRLGEGLVNPGYQEKPAWFKESFLDIREDVAEAADANRRVILYFYQDGCPYCAKLLRDNFADKGIVRQTRENFDVVAINMWGDREVTGFDGSATTEKALAGDLQVQFTPTMLFLDEEGQVVLRVNGYFPPAKFRAALSHAAARQEGEAVFAGDPGTAAPTAVNGELHLFPEALPYPLKLAENRSIAYRPLLVLFEQPECAACDELHEDIFQRREVAIALTNLDLAQVDVRSGEPVQTPDGRELPARQWARELGIQFAPSLVFFDRAGREVFRTEAYLRSFHVHGAVDYVVSGAYHDEPSFQRFLQHRTEVLRARGIEVDLMQ